MAAARLALGAPNGTDFPDAFVVALADGACVDEAFVVGADVVDGAVLGEVVPVVVDGSVVVVALPVALVVGDVVPVGAVVVGAVVVVCGGAVVVVVTGVGSVVLARALPGASRANPTARVATTAGRALRRVVRDVRCMVPLQTSGVATGTGPRNDEPPASRHATSGAARTWSGLRPAYLDGNGAAPHPRQSGSPPRGGLRLRVSAGIGPASPGVRRGCRPEATAPP
jgi:hypothetical protein